MSTLNAQNAVVFGFTAQQFNNIFTNSTPNTIGPDSVNNLGNTPGITSISNSYATVTPFTGVNSQTAGNAQAIVEMFPSITTDGAYTYFNLSPSSVFYNTTSETQVSYYYPQGKTYFGVLNNTSSIQINPAGNATANLSGSTPLNQSQVAEGQLQFTFIPGSTQSLQVSYETGTTITNSVANGISNSTMTGETITVTTGLNFSGAFPGATGAVNSSASKAWTQQQTQQISYTSTVTNAVNTNVTTQVTVDVNSAQPNSQGQYIYTNSNGQNFTLVPGNQYIVEVLIDQCAYNTPVPNTFQITGPAMTLPMQLGIRANINVNGTQGPINGIEPSQPLTNNVEQAINAANSLGYNLYSNVDTSLFTYAQSPVATATYSGLVNSTTTTGTYSTINILPVATSSDAQKPKALSSSLLSSSARTLNATVDSNLNPDTTLLDLNLAAKKLFSSTGVFYDNTKTESQLITQAIELVGGKNDYVKLGNKNYTTSNFSDSQVSFGSGYNTIKISPTDNHNSFSLGNGSSNVDLSGNGNSINFNGGYNNLQINGSTGINYILAGSGPIALTFNDSSGFTQISNWDNTQDFMRFNDNINLKDVHVTFDTKNWSYNVYVADKLIANIITNGGLSYADAQSVVSPKIYAAPLPYNLQSNAGFLNGLYVDAFNAAPDTAGITYWTQQLDSGVSRNSVIQSFFTSAQFTAQNPTNSQYVNSLYEDLLGRPSDASGLNFWTSVLDNGQSKTAVIGSFLNSAEFNHLIGHA